MLNPQHAWRVEIRKGRRDPRWATVAQGTEDGCRLAFAKARERAAGKYLRVLDGNGRVVDLHLAACWRTPYQGTGDLRCERRPGHSGLHGAEGQVWSRCNGRAHGEHE